MALDFSENVAGLGILTGSFYVGLGLGQVPGGILAAQIGPRRSAIYGTILASSACFLCGITTAFVQLILLRFVAGLGMALVFGSGVTLIAKNFDQNGEGLGVGVFNAAMSVGGAIGLFTWAILAYATGWRLSLMISGGIGLVSAIGILLFVPNDDLAEEFSVKRSALMRVLGDKPSVLLGVKLFVMMGSSSLITAILLYYLEQIMRVTPALAGLVTALSLTMGIPASLVAGRIYDRNKNAAIMLLVSGLGTAIGLAAAAVSAIYASILSSIMVGYFTSFGSTIAFAAARDINKAGKEYEPLAIAWVNGLSLYSGFVMPVVFSIVALRIGYMISWLGAGAAVFLLVASLFVLSRIRPGGWAVEPRRLGMQL